MYVYIFSAIPVQAWTDAEDSGWLRLPDFMTIGTWWPTPQPPLPQ